MVRGRGVHQSDSLASTQVAVVGETLTYRLWPGEDPIGREITIDFVNDPPRQVIGVVADVRETTLAARLCAACVRARRAVAVGLPRDGFNRRA